MPTRCAPVPAAGALLPPATQSPRASNREVPSAVPRLVREDPGHNYEDVGGLRTDQLDPGRVGLVHAPELYAEHKLRHRRGHALRTSGLRQDDDRESVRTRSLSASPRRRSTKRAATSQLKGPECSTSTWGDRRRSLDLQAGKGEVERRSTRDVFLTRTGVARAAPASARTWRRRSSAAAGRDRRCRVVEDVI